MKKFVALMLSIVLLGTMFVMTGCTKKTAVVMTVDGFAADSIVLATKQDGTGCSRVEEPKGVITFTFNGLSEGDHAMLLVDLQGNSCPFTLKIHNGKVETVTPEGVTVTATIK